MPALVRPLGLISITLNTCFLNILAVFRCSLITLRLESCPIIHRSSELSAILRCGGVGRYKGDRSEAASTLGNTCLCASWPGQRSGKGTGVGGPAKALTLVW